jgi:type IV pilus assembly protein PilB
MPLGRIQTQILDKLEALGKLAAAQKAVLFSRPDELTGDQLDQILLNEFKVSPFPLHLAKCRALGLTPFNVSRYKIHPGTFEKIDLEFCQKNTILPVGQVGNVLLVAFANPFDTSLAAKIQDKTGLRVARLLGRESDIRDKLKKDNAPEQVQFSDVVDQLGAEFSEEEAEIRDEDLEHEDSAPIIQLANRIIEDAYFAGASDIHIEPWERELVVRYRIDGLTQEKLRLPAKVTGALVARLKIMCNLDIAERRLPQDGRIIFKQYTKKNVDIDLRVSTAPLSHGEGVVMRILDKQKSTLPLTALGYSEANLSKYRDCIRQPYGMILHCGPTGSGKSMTLYSALNEINTPDVVIRTAEDPIEYTLAGINQMQMHRQIGLTFATALRSFLRQDPDIILVGEIRDKETANIAVEAALTGHLLISTLHTNDAPSTVARLTDMGIEPFMISSSLVCVCAQRLMRRVCKACRVAYEPDGREKDILQRAIGWSGPIYKAHAHGCSKCNGTGYKGRVGIHELMVTNEELIEGINKEIETAELKKIAMRGGMKTLHQDSMLKVKDGISTMAEALSIVTQDMESRTPAHV